MQGAVKLLLECMGEDVEREGLLSTPLRYAKTLLSLTKGYQANLETLVNGALFSEAHDGMVVVKDIAVHNLYGDHLLPFKGKIHIGYISRGKVIGLSKLTRIVEMSSQRLQLQDRLINEVADAVMTVTNAQGVAVAMEATHLCMVMRGIDRASSSTTVTTCVRGCFESSASTRREFVSLVRVRET